MTEQVPVPEHRRHGLYYPYFHVRDQRWLKAAALYWPKIVRIVPDGYQTRDSAAVRDLAGHFIERRPPGDSVVAVAPRFLDLVANHRDELRTRFHVPAFGRVTSRSADDGRKRLTGVHASEMTPELREALMDAQLATRGQREAGPWPPESSIDGSEIVDPHRWMQPPDRELDEWVLMDPALVAVYTSVLAEDFATANMLQPTTDQDDAYVAMNNWTTDRIGAVLLNSPVHNGSVPPGEVPEVLAFLALDLVVPARLDQVPVSRIIDIRERYQAEFFAFGQAVDQAAASMAELANVRDQAVLEDYLRQVVAVRFAQPLDDLRKRMKEATGDAMMMSINVKTELPAGAALAGGALLSGHPLVAGTSAAAIALMAVRRGFRQQRESAQKSAPAASYLLHTHRHLQPTKLLRRTLQRLGRIVGTASDSHEREDTPPSNGWNG